VYFSREGKSREEGGRLNFLNFENDRIEHCFELLCQLKLRYQAAVQPARGDLCVMATGGGAYKYYDRMKEILGVAILREDEMECLIIGTLGSLLMHVRA
jgi:type II pantothenate kinase